LLHAYYFLLHVTQFLVHFFLEPGKSLRVLLLDLGVGFKQFENRLNGLLILPALLGFRVRLAIPIDALQGELWHFWDFRGCLVQAFFEQVPLHTAVADTGAALRRANWAHRFQVFLFVLLSEVALSVAFINAAE